MAQKVNPIIFRKNPKGLYFLNYKLSSLKTLLQIYSLKNFEQLKSFLENFFLFFGLFLDSFLIVETNNSGFFISLKYRSLTFTRVSEHNKSLKHTLIKALLRLIPVKHLCLRMLNNTKIFVPKKKKNRLTRVLKKIKLSCCDPFSLVKTLRYTLFSSNFFAYIIANELKMIKKKHNRFLALCGKLLTLSVQNKTTNSKLKGLKICVKGKFNGRLRAKTKMLQVGELSLQKMSSIVDFCSVKAITSEGVFGIKVWSHY